MFHQVLVLLNVIGFDGDNGAGEQGDGAQHMVVLQTEYLLRRACDTYALQQSVDKSGHLDYEAYDPHQTINPFFSNRREPVSYEHIIVGDAIPLDFDPRHRAEHWTDVERVIEACLLALSRMEGSVRVVTREDGVVERVLEDSVEEVVSSMVDPGSSVRTTSNGSKGIQFYCSCGGEAGSRLFNGEYDGTVQVEEWTTVIARPIEA